MTHPSRIVLTAILALAGALPLAAAVAPAAAQVAPLACAMGVKENCGGIGVELASANCGAVAAAVARQQGGEVIGAPRAIQQGGRTMCVVTILIRDPSGQRPPTRKQVTVPAG